MSTSIDVHDGNVMVNGINATALLGRQALRIAELEALNEQARKAVRSLLQLLRRAQDDEFESVVVDFDNLTWNCTAKTPEAEPAKETEQ